MKFKKAGYILIFLLFFSCITTIDINAYDLSYIENKIDLQKALDQLPDEAKDLIPSKNNDADSIVSSAKNISSSSISNFLIKTFKKTLSSFSKKYISLLGILTIISIINTSKNSLASAELSKTVNLATIMVLAVFLYDLLYTVWEIAELYLTTMDKVINALLPTMTLLYTAGGNLSTAVGNSTGTAILLTIMNYILQHALFPILKICFGLSIACTIGGINGISEIIKSIKSFFAFALSGVMTIFSIFLAFKTCISASADGVTARTVKFAGSFVPIVGSALGESVKNIMAGLSLIKSSVGFIGIIVIIFITVPPLLSVFINKFCLNLCAGTAYLFGCDTHGAFIKEINSLLGFLLAVILCVSVVFIFELTLFIMISPAFGG